MLHEGVSQTGNNGFTPCIQSDRNSDFWKHCLDLSLEAAGVNVNLLNYTF